MFQDRAKLCTYDATHSVDPRTGMEVSTAWAMVNEGMSTHNSQQPQTAAGFFAFLIFMNAAPSNRDPFRPVFSIPDKAV